MKNAPKKLIEVDLPIRQISEHARKDQNVRKGHLHTMHVWWATRPLASCRAVILATIVPDPADENCPDGFRAAAREALKPFTGRNLSDPMALRQALLQFVADFAAWDAGVNPTYLTAARRLVSAAHPEGPPLIMDPFAGAGSIPFEALRVGANTFAGDLNPIPVLLNKVSQEYLPKFGHRLAEGVEKWGKWVLEQARKKLSAFYPADSRGNIPLAYIWARTITCEGPACGAEVPLLGMLWLSKKAKSRVALRYRGDRAAKRVHVEVFEPKSNKEVQPGIVNRMAVTCPCCGYTTPYKATREQLRAKHGGTRDARMVAVITLDKGGGRHYRLPTVEDINAARSAEGELSSIEVNNQGHYSFIPDEPTPPDGTLGYRINKYGMERWSDVYLSRQALALGTMCRLVDYVRAEILSAGDDANYADAVASCIALAVSNTAPMLSACSYFGHDHFRTVFQGSGLPMKPDFAEANPLMSRLVGGVEYAHGLIVSFLTREGDSIRSVGTVARCSATRTPLPDDSLTYLVTDPPYYDAIPYAALSDFCFVWLKRALVHVHPGLFSSQLSPKTGECIMDPGPPADEGPPKDRRYFEATMQAALADARRALKPDGVGVVIFAHKGTAGWEALLNALVSAGWMVTASWPIHTENTTRMRAKDSAALSSSVHLVCRPRENPDGSLRDAEVGDWREVLAELPRRISEWMPRLRSEGIVGADAIFACLGPALEIFSRYARVEKASGEEVTLRVYLEQVWAAVSQEALNQVFQGVDAASLEEDARLTAMWLWTLSTGNGKPDSSGEDDAGGDADADDSDNNKNKKKSKAAGFSLEYDAARKIAQGLGAHLENLQTVVAIEKDTARLLPVSERTKALFGKDESDAPAGRRKKSKQKQMAFEEELEQAEVEGGWGKKGAPKVGETTLDRVHQAMILFAAGRSEAMKRFLVDEGVGRDGKFWTLAQALSALYPTGTDEKRWVDGVLARKKGLGF